MKNVVLGTIAAFAGLFASGCGAKGDPAVTGAGLSKEEARKRLTVVGNLKWLALATENYCSNYNAFPPADGTGGSNRMFGSSTERTLVGYSWRAHVMEYIAASSQEEADLRNRMQKGTFPLATGAKPGEEWNRPGLNGFELRQFDGSREVSENWHTFYRVFIGNGAAFEPKQQLTHKDFTDGLENTILIVEANEAVPWPKPEELDYDPAKPLPKFGGAFPDGFYAVFADGTARFIKNGTDEKAIRAMITRNGGETIAELPPKVDTEALRKVAGYED